MTPCPPTRRSFLGLAGGAAFTLLSSPACGRPASVPRRGESRSRGKGTDNGTTLFLAGDVMTGRGIDQVLPHSVDPVLHEPWVKSAVTYVDIAEEANGPIPDEVPPAYVWGDALEILRSRRPATRIVNLETAVTADGEPWPGKGIHYRMHPGNVDVLTIAGIDCCVLANNHVLDWGRAGLDDTLRNLAGAGLAHPGAGRSLAEAAAPAILPVSDGRVLVFSFGHPSSGVPEAWAGTPERSGVWLAEELSERTVDKLAGTVAEWKRPGDLVVASIHWGGNWGYDIPPPHQWLARRIIERASVDVVHGHSSHHPKGIEIHHDRPIFYGCGDFINDYEGISGHEGFRSELRLMYLPTLDPTGRLVTLEMVPVEAYRFSLRRAGPEETRWLESTMDRECRPLGCRVERTVDGALALRWG